MGGGEDYRDDVRISPDILKQLADAYRRIRNTVRFMLGNLYDFDPERHWLAPEAGRSWTAWPCPGWRSCWPGSNGPTRTTNFTRPSTACTSSAPWS